MERPDQLFGLAAVGVKPQRSLGVRGRLLDPALRLEAAGQVQVRRSGIGRIAAFVEQARQPYPLVVGVGAQPQDLLERLDRPGRQAPALLEIGELRIGGHRSRSVAHTLIDASQVLRIEGVGRIIPAQLLEDLERLRVSAGVEECNRRRRASIGILGKFLESAHGLF